LEFRRVLFRSTLVTILKSNIIPDDMHRDCRWRIGIFAHTITTSLYTRSISRSFKGFGLITVVKRPTVFNGIGGISTDEVKAIVAVPPCPTTAEYIACAGGVGWVPPETVHISAATTVRDIIPVVVSITV